MSNNETTIAAPTPTVKMPVLPLLLSVVVAVLLAVGGCAGVLYGLIRSGRLGTGSTMGGTVGSSTTSAAAQPGSAAPATPTKSLPLEPLLANLADADGHAYLRLGVTLKVLEEEKKGKPEEKEAKGPSPLEAGLRDTVLSVLGREQSAALLAPDGKEQLKKKLMAAFAEHNEDARVHEVFFTDFLVQR